jgi:ABC-2 type transport system ATP-binding protein
VLAWLRRYLDRDKSVRTGPRFEWVADDGRWRSGADYPLAAAGPLTGRGSGTLLLAPGAGAGSAVEARPDSSGFSLAIAPPQRPVQVVGAPTLNVRYHATGTGAVPRMYAQVADLGHGVVLGNQVTPVQLVLDGGTHTVRLRLESLAAAATSASRYALQLVAASQVFAGQSRTTASVTLSDVRISLPTVDPARAARRASVRVSLIRRGPHRLRARVRVLHGPARNLRIAVSAGRRVAATGRAGAVRRHRTLALHVKRTIKPRRYRVTTRWTDPAGRHEATRRVRAR